MTVRAITLFLILFASQAMAQNFGTFSNIEDRRIVPDVDKVHATTITLLTNQGLCSATAVGEHVIATASHCFGFHPAANHKQVAQAVAGESVLLDGVLAKIIKTIRDKHDHTLLVVDSKFKYYARFSKRTTLSYGDEVFYFGNSHVFKTYRYGRIAGAAEPDWLLIDCHGGKGDSGAAVFDKWGEVIGIITQEALGTVNFMMFEDMDFTPKQLRDIGIPY